VNVVNIVNIVNVDHAVRDCNRSNSARVTARITASKGSVSLPESTSRLSQKGGRVSQIVSGDRRCPQCGEQSPIKPRPIFRPTRGIGWNRRWDQMGAGTKSLKCVSCPRIVFQFMARLRNPSNK